MFGNLSGAHLLILLLVILLIFGAPKLPGLAKSLGQSMKILKKEVRELSDDEKAPQQPLETPQPPAAPQPPVAPQSPVVPQAPPAPEPQHANPAATTGQQSQNPAA